MPALRVKSGTPNKKTARRRPSEVMRWSYVAFSAIAFFRRYAMKPMPAKQRIITAQAAADLFGPLGWVVLERQSRQLVCRICGGRTELWELRRLFHNRQKLLEFAGTPYAEISTAESFAVAWLICRAVILSNLARAKFRLHALSRGIFPLGRRPLCRGPPLKGVLVLPLPKPLDFRGQGFCCRVSVVLIRPASAFASPKVCPYEKG